MVVWISEPPIWSMKIPIADEIRQLISGDIPSYLHCNHANSGCKEDIWNKHQEN